MKHGLSIFIRLLDKVTPFLTYLALLWIRLIMGWEFLESGLEKLHGHNWFMDIIHKFPAPFRLLPVSVNWAFATYTELLGAALLFLGLATRFSAISLIVITIVAISVVHWPEQWHSLSDLWMGYTITDEGHGNFKLPLLYLIMLFMLVAQGGGKISLDGWLFSLYSSKYTRPKVWRDNIRPLKRKK
jgi:putative oxidoreductase